MKLEVNELTTVRDRTLLENTSLNCEFNKLQLSGRNGSGKSTFIQELINGNKCINISTNKIIHINNKPIVFENLSIIDNFTLLAAKDVEHKSFLKYFTIDLNQKVKTLSGGQKQILHILIALSHKADLYIIDEPFNNLDQMNRNIVNNLLSEEDSNLLIVAHGYNLQYCDVHLKIEDRKLCYEQ